MTDFFIKTIPLPVPRPAEADILPVRVYETITEQFDIISSPTVGWNLIKEKFMDTRVNIYEFAEKFSDFLYWLGIMLVVGAVVICVAEGFKWIVKKFFRK